MHADAGGGSLGAVTELHVLYAGAAKGLVEALAPALYAGTGATLRWRVRRGRRDPRTNGRRGARCDVIILTGAMLDALAHEGRVDASTVVPLGRVRTGIAVRAGEPLPDIGDREALRRTLLGGGGAVPARHRTLDGRRARIEVLRALDIHADVIARVRAFANGAIAMRELAQAREPGLVGCTQITEILYTPGVALVGPLPGNSNWPPCIRRPSRRTAQQPVAALRFVQLLTAPESRGIAPQRRLRDLTFRRRRGVRVVREGASTLNN